MKNRQRLVLVLLPLVMVHVVTGCDAVAGGLSSGEEQAIQASGVIETQKVDVSAEIAGKIIDVAVGEGDQVRVGEVLFQLDTSTVEAQREQALAQLESARSNLASAEASLAVSKAGLRSAEAGLESAELQYQQVLQEARRGHAPNRVEGWSLHRSPEFELPAWYFSKDERRDAAEDELEQARQALQTEQESYQDLLQESGNEEIAAAEQRLAEAQEAFAVAQSLLDREVSFEGEEEIRETRETVYEAAETELEAAYEHYQQVLSDADAQDILEGRARLTVAQERYQLARDRVASYRSGEDALPVLIAKKGVAQAQATRDQAQAQVEQTKTSITAAEKAVRQAESSLELIDLQLEKHRVQTPVSGTLLTRTVDPGEVIQPGVTAMTIGILKDLSVTVYIPEDQYGQISVGDEAQLEVDSFPEETFRAEVIRIADEAEYTPRNVQTKEERQKTVYAVKLAVLTGRDRLKPGMPTDVIFGPSE